MLAFEENIQSPAVIKVVGVGGAGMNAVERMVVLDTKGVELIAMNTDEQVLRRSSASEKIHLGSKLTRGMGAGARPEIGQQAAIEDRDKIVGALKGADMVFITAGMGGGTGTGAAPIVAEVAKELGALTVGVVSMPFKTEGGKKNQIARDGQGRLRDKVDTLITIPNDAVFKIADRNTGVDAAFKIIDDVLARSVSGISNIINTTGHVNVDFADVRTVMGENGDAMIGVGEGSGDNRITDALQNAIHNPLLEGKSIDGAGAVLINIVAGNDLSIYEYGEIQEKIHEQVSREAEIIVGFTEDANLDERVSITVIATGFGRASANQPVPEEKQEEKQELPKAVGAEQVYNIPSRGSQPERMQEHIQGSQNSQQGQTEKPLVVPPQKPQLHQQEQLGFSSFPDLDTDNERNLSVPAFERRRKKMQE